MALTHIRIDKTKTLGVKLLRLGAVQRESVTLAQELKDVMDGMFEGADFSYLEAEFGLPAGKGQTAYNMVVNYLSKIDTNAAITDLRRDIRGLVNTLAG